MQIQTPHLINIRKELIKELKESEDKLGHSPKKREVPNLANKCYYHFGSFNKAKKIAGLEIKNVIITKFPKNAFKKDKDLAAILSYITFDGHLYKDLKGFYFSSKNIKDLEDFVEIIKRKFGLPPRYHLFNSGSRNQTHAVYFFNKPICNYLLKMGAPKGDKVIQKFDVPKWIVNSKEFSREYLKIAYLCEGSLGKEKGRNPRITINTAKCIDIIDSGINFMNTLRKMLKKFKIGSNELYFFGIRKRKRDNKISKDIRFRINVQDNDKFIREIGWLK